MHFLDIPKEVIDDSVLKFLSWNDLLRFRRVCKWTEAITNAYIWVNPNRAPEIEINEEDKTLEAFLDMSVRTTKLFLNNAKSGYYFYKQIEEKTQQEFLEDYGPHVKSFRVAQITLCPFGRELDFIDGMKNLKDFEAAKFGPEEVEWGDDEMALWARVKEETRLTPNLFPKIFLSLETIRIGQNDEHCADILKYSNNFLLDYPQFKSVCLPYDSTYQSGEIVLTTPVGQMVIHGALENAFLKLLLYIRKRPNKVYTSELRLEFLDFENYHHENGPSTLELSQEIQDKLFKIWLGSRHFLEICFIALKIGLKLRNVNPTWFCARFEENLRGKYVCPELGTVVESLVGLDPCVMTLNMPNLEEIRIPSTSCCVSVTGDVPRPEWPALKKLDVTVDGKEGSLWEMDLTRFQDIDRSAHQRTSVMFMFLFKDVVRTNMRELTIRFLDGKGKKEVSVPRIEDIVMSCPNLKKITLGNWMGTNKALVELWNGLLGLEEICFEYCKELGNVAFVGEGVGNPAFLGLKNLKKLTLKGLDKMPKITDTMFCLVLSKMKLKELVLTSDEPVEKVTKKGISTLLEGPFAETIERFPFRDWSLADMTAEDFGEMGKKFRSYNMI